MSEFVVTNYADIKSQLHGFFTSIGWTVAGTVAEPIVTPVGGTKNYTFTIDTDRSFVVADATDTTFAARVISPIQAGNALNTVNFKAPTHLFAYGEADWAALVIQYGFNLYRHIYIGQLQLLGNPTGGDILSCSNRIGSTSTSQNMDSGFISLQFAGYNFSPPYRGYIPTTTPHGAVFVQHADLSSSVKYFRGDNRSRNLNNSVNTLSAEVAFGAHIGPLETDRRVANAPVAGGVVLLPYTIYCTNKLPPNMVLIPLGTPKGIYATNISSMDPEEERTVATVTYKVFPDISKKDYGTIARPAGDYYVSEETSRYSGIAYKVVG